MSEYIIPELGAKGVYAFKAPFDTLVNKQTEYECVSVRKIADALNAGENVFMKYYSPSELNESDYTRDINDGVSLISLRSAMGQILYIPNSYITSYPDASGVRYRVMALAVNLGAVPDTMNLETIIGEVRVLVGARMGIDPEIVPVATSQPAMVSHNDHDRLEIARVSKVTIENSLHRRYDVLLAERDELLRKNAALTQFIKDRNLI